MTGRILCIEGPSAVGKTTLAEELARACGAGIVAELSAGPSPDIPDSATWFVERHVERWSQACGLARRAPFVVLDGDPFKGLWYNWIFASDGWPGMEASAALYHQHVRQGTLAFPDLYILLHAPEAQLRQRRSGDPTRMRRNFDKHLALIEPQRRYFAALHDAAPGRVLFLETTDRDALVPAIRAAVAALDSRPTDSSQLLEKLVGWVRTQPAPTRR